MGAITQQTAAPDGLPTSVPPAAKKTNKPVRPSLLGPNGSGRRTSSFVSNGHSISYRSKTGRTLTFEFKTPAAKPAGDYFNKLAPLPESEPTPSAAQPITVGKGTSTTSTNATSATAAVLARAKSVSFPESAELVVRAKNGAAVAAGEAEPGMLVGIYDTLTFWCMEAVEVACWGPYDDTTAQTPAAVEEVCVA
jgi:hypothetical protein